MRLTRVYVPQPLTSGAQCTLPADAAEHLSRVLRLTAGAELIVFNGAGGEFQAQLRSAGKRGALISIGEFRPREAESPLHVTLLQCLARGDKMDLVVQKATELGVTRIVPVRAERSVVQLGDARVDRRLAHWRAVAASACEQCGRNRLPEILAPRDLAGACELASPGARLMLLPAATRSLTGAACGLQAVALLVGPEGGFSAAELRLATASGFAAVHAGPRVLRTETAAIAALATLQALAGDWRNADR
jgi:16S rRNA (uracil1498-N3)-methyltransferase